MLAKKKTHRLLQTPVCFPAKGFRKKRGRKEDLRSRKEAAHGFRNLSVIKILWGFEHQITELKTKFDNFMNNIKEYLTFNPLPF